MFFPLSAQRKAPSSHAGKKHKAATPVAQLEAESRPKPPTPELVASFVMNERPKLPMVATRANGWDKNDLKEARAKMVDSTFRRTDENNHFVALQPLDLTPYRKRLSAAVRAPSIKRVPTLIRVDTLNLTKVLFGMLEGVPAFDRERKDAILRSLHSTYLVSMRPERGSIEGLEAAFEHVGFVTFDAGDARQQVIHHAYCLDRNSSFNADAVRLIRIKCPGFFVAFARGCILGNYEAGAYENAGVPMQIDDHFLAGVQAPEERVLAPRQSMPKGASWGYVQACMRADRVDVLRLPVWNHSQNSDFDVKGSQLLWTAHILALCGDGLLPTVVVGLVMRYISLLGVIPPNSSIMIHAHRVCHKREAPASASASASATAMVELDESVGSDSDA